MGWTHDHRDLTQRRGADDDAALTVATEVSERTEECRGTFPPGEAADLRLGIPRIIRRRARWVSARLRHPRGR
ncbi:hypothetical protein [Streptomyces caatingaensis]|uniref:Uncharacterized protein n=1 Tax=Streptomyces caatingaensis TaxID=1678637 RepID=A0A0K9X6B7_9ACTN|nr:hypothetical protein [Streptomyces caatingaensis]KNB49009.1 hypothetical protein AC230_27040 [Streptomyces caatingaensis]